MIPAKYWSPTKKLMLLGAMAGGKAVEDTATGNPLTFLTDLSKPLKSLLIPFTPIQEGSGDPSPVNVRPIVPWEGLTVFGNGGNQLDPQKIDFGYINNSGSHVNQKNNCLTDYIPYKSGAKIVVGLDAESVTSSGVAYFDKNKNFIRRDSRATQYVPYTFNGNTEDGFIRVWINPDNENHTIEEYQGMDMFVSYDESATAYEPYAPITETDISFPSTVYGGTLDAVSGVLTVKYGFVTLDDSVPVALANWRPTDGTSAWLYALSEIPSDVSINSAICDKVKQTTYGSIFNGSVGVATNILSGDYGLAIRIPVENLSTKEAIYAYLAENPYHVAYQLATPQEIQLTPQQITALVGNNTIWSDADGSMTAVYLKKG